MEARQILKVMLFSTLSLALVVIGIFVYYKLTTVKPPTKAELEKKQQEELDKRKGDSIKVQDLIWKNFSELQSKKLENDRLFKLIDSIRGESKKWYDSSYNLSNKSIVSVRDTTRLWRGYAERLRDSLKTARDSYLSLQVEVERLKKSIEEKNKAINKRQDSVAKTNFNEYAAIFNNASSKEIAKILEQIDERDASYLLKKMKTKLAGKVLEAMKPDKAAAIMMISSVE